MARSGTLAHLALCAVLCAQSACGPSDAAGPSLAAGDASDDTAASPDLLAFSDAQDTAQGAAQDAGVPAPDVADAVDAADSAAPSDLGGEADATSDSPENDTASADTAPEDSADADKPDAVVCGDKICALGEDLASCSVDCAVCGDGVCSPGEGVSLCPNDCCGTCGDGKCKGYACGEDSKVCGTDCKMPCGNQVCDKGETPFSCSEDCAFKACGNGICESEDGGPSTCPQDCGNACGDCTCDADEDFLTCPVDCGYCGDGTCSPCKALGEAPTTCPIDCKLADCTPGKVGECDDGTICTTDACTPAGQCVHVFNTVPCDDSNVCTLGDACAGGVCMPGAVTLDCEDGNACTSDGCEPVAGCKHGPLSGSTCEDGNACTINDSCVSGACEGGKPVDCDDGDACTKDACYAVGGCDHAPAGAECDDGSACTTDSCDAKSGCQHVNVAGSCEDGNACTSGDACAEGKCVGGPALPCKDESACTDDACDPATGCTYTPNTAPCDDTNVCTTMDICDGGACKGSAPLDCDDTNVCTSDACDPQSGCSHTPTASVCDDGDACTSGDACSAGACLPGKPIDCDDANPCTDDGCVKASGCKHTPNTLPCSDASACTVVDLCKDGACKPGPAVWCDDGDGCTLDTCEADTGLCKHVATEACFKPPCLSSPDCTSGLCEVEAHICLECSSSVPCVDPAMVCIDGTCAAGITCGSNLACKAAGKVCDVAKGHCVECLTDDECETGSLCVGARCIPKVPCAKDADCPAVCDKALGACVECGVSADCLSGGWCGPDHRCRAPRCKAGACLSTTWMACRADTSGFDPTECADGNVCTTDTCDAATYKPGGTACVFSSNSAPCDDGSLCTKDDVCKDGACAGVPALDCNDKNPCTDDACDPKTGACLYANNTAQCTDNTVCTTGDVCKDGVCKSGPPLNCDDGNVCTTDGCDAIGGCSHASNGAACDAKACTVGDACKDGNCVSSGKPKLVDVTLGPSSKDDRAYAIMSHPNAPYLLVGTANLVHSGNVVSNDLYAMSLDASGTKISTGQGGSTNVYELARAGVVLADKSILLVGYYWLNNADTYASRVTLGGAAAFNAGYNANGFSDEALAVTTTSDGGAMVAGYWTKAAGNTEARVFKIAQSNGAKSGDWSYGGAANDYARAIEPHPVSGFLVAGSTTSKGAGGYDGWVFKISPSGVLEWEKTYGGAAEDHVHALIVYPDGGALVAGSTASKGAGYFDGWLVRIDPAGAVLWERTLGAGNDEYANALAAAPDGGVLVAGWTAPSGATDHDAWIARTDGLGNVMWAKSHGGAGDDVLTGVIPTTDGGWAAAGYTNSKGSGNYDIYFLKLDAWGDASCTAAAGCGDVGWGTCDDGNPCSADTCEPGSGCAHTPLFKGSPCGDGKVCGDAGQCD